MHSINVTPLTDVLLVLLITFLLTATSFQELSSEIPLPRVAEAREVSEQMTRVVVDSRGAVQWPPFGDPVLNSEQAFAKLRTQSDKPILALAVHRELAYSKLYPLLLSAQQAGWRRIVLLTEADS
jgi:biopolymer transport protein ExbD